MKTAAEPTTITIKMLVVRGKIGCMSVDVLRDTGCSGVIVKQTFVDKGEYLNKHGHLQMVHNSLKKVSIARVDFDTSYYTGSVEALCLPDALYDFIIRNICGARAADNPDSTWNKASMITTRSQTRRGDTLVSLRVPTMDTWKYVDRDAMRCDYEAAA